MNLLLQDLREIQLLRENKPQEVAEIAWAIVEKRGFIVDTRETKGLFRLMGRFQNLGEITQQIEKLQAPEHWPRSRNDCISRQSIEQRAWSIGRSFFWAVSKGSSRLR